MVAVFVVALVALVLWRPMESGRPEMPAEGQKDAEHGYPAIGTAGNPWHVPAPEGAPVRAWWDVPPAGDADADKPLAMRKIRTPSGAVRFVSALTALDEIAVGNASGGAGGDADQGSAADFTDAAGEPSDLDDDHPGSYWSNLGYTTVRAVLADLGVIADKAWVESAGGEILVSVADVSSGAGPRRERLVVFTPEVTPGDHDGDGVASGLDLARFLRQLGAKHIDADVNEDGAVDQRDLLVFLQRWGQGAG